MKKVVLILFSLFCSLCFSMTAYAEFSNKPYGWGIVKSRNGIPADAGEELNRIVQKHGAFYKGDAKEKVLYLTFDNGYENGYTAKILDVLKKQNVPAIFFVTGHYLETAPDLAKRMVEEGHLIGNHSWHHPDMTTLSQTKMLEELSSVQKKTQELTGQKSMMYLRPPRGIFSEKTLNITNKAGYINVFWSLAYKDWDVKNQKGASYAYQQITSQVHPGAIMLIHSISKDNAEALDAVITDLKKKGYAFKSLDYLVMKREVKSGIM
ncbi:delta-lactam-biosynthetic de-N-acetylase [Bacillus testis]|uniref:delta-lactam-biosynthetic de-N-acetylase n=1 Tax=Bacillus testis TaxID=1622072 RepID=UPI00067F4218|nr:delta-lactam-biosynthetic de-N-acetylase [Bacillus testis]